MVYDEIASDFNRTRHSPWPAVLSFLRSQPPGALGADIGCGNGKYLIAASRYSRPNSDDPPIPPLAPILAMDRSMRLADIVRKKGFDVIVADILRLPYHEERLDFFLCIAVLHHLCTSDRRLQAVHELARILHSGGRGLIQVWAKEQRDPNSGRLANYVQSRQRPQNGTHSFRNPIETTEAPTMLEPVQNARLPVHVPGTEFSATDMLVSWKKKLRKPADDNTVLDGTTPLLRYYHLFTKGELEALVEQVPCLRVENAFYEQGNWAVVVEKVYCVNES
ncbi:unnamed protein product [Dicrocoelium dendriticum]|nr:unnamed protein product [Dicrocoelium dendriticum]